jgi:hypothetical protein
MAVPYTFGSATTSIPLSQLDSNFATGITLGNTAIQLGNTVTTLNNMTLGNVTISSGTSSLQTNVANATGVLLEANGGTGTTTGYYGFKNRIINGAMVIDQRNAGASVTPTDAQYCVDRWRAVASAASKFTVQQSTTAPDGFTNSLLLTSSSAYTPSTSEAFGILQLIEGFNCADLMFGTATAKTVTVSFWVRSSLTGTFGGFLNNASFNRAYPFTYTISSANTWEQKSVTIAGDTTGTWATNSSGCIGVGFSIGAGATISATAGAWGAGTKLGATGQTQLISTSGATFYVTGVQLEKGSTATSFDYRPYGTELALCQRYCQTVSGVGNYSPMTTTGAMPTTGVARSGIPLLVTMRTSPSATFSAANTFLVQQNGSNNLTPSAVGASSGGSNQSFFFVDFTVSGGVAGTAANVFDNNSTSAKITLTSEL